MLAIARILRTGARLLLLDEPTEGLAPVIVQQFGRTTRAIKSLGFAVLLVEQNFRFAATVADRHYVMEHGRVVDMIPNAELERSMDKQYGHLDVRPCVSVTSRSPEADLRTKSPEGRSASGDQRRVRALVETLVVSCGA